MRSSTLNLLTVVTMLAALTSALLLAAADGARVDADSTMGQAAAEVDPAGLLEALPPAAGSGQASAPEPKR